MQFEQIDLLEITSWIIGMQMWINLLRYWIWCKLPTQLLAFLKSYHFKHYNTDLLKWYSFSETSIFGFLDKYNSA